MCIRDSRIRMCEQGHWGTLWAHAEMQTSPGTQDKSTSLGRSQRESPNSWIPRGTLRPRRRFGDQVIRPQRTRSNRSLSPLNMPQTRTCPSHIAIMQRKKGIASLLLLKDLETISRNPSINLFGKVGQGPQAGASITGRSTRRRQPHIIHAEVFHESSGRCSS